MCGVSLGWRSKAGRALPGAPPTPATWDWHRLRRAGLTPRAPPWAALPASEGLPWGAGRAMGTVDWFMLSLWG
jgi:hypothetical protein